MQPRHVRVAVRLLKTSIIRQLNERKIHERCVNIHMQTLTHNAYFLFPCSVESSEIDLSEFQVENGEGGDDGHGGDGGNDGPAQPSTAAAEPTSGNAGGTPILLLLSFLILFMNFIN